jgi:hypothetical protein
VDILKDDKLLKAGAIGALCTILSEIVSQILIVLGFGKYSIFNISSMLVTINRPSIVMGLLVSVTVGVFSAIILYYLLILTGSDNVVIKSVMGSVLLWLALEMFFTMFIEGRFFSIRPISSYYVHLVAAIIFGISEGILFNRILFDKYAEHYN